MNDYKPRAAHIKRWYLTEFEQHERVVYRRRRDSLAVAIGLGLGVAWSGWVIWWLGGW